MLTERPIAATSFMSGPSDDLIVTDVYNKTDDTVINKFPDLVTPAIDQNLLAAQDKSIADDFRGGLTKITNPSSSSILSSASGLLSSGLATVKTITGVLSKAAASVGGPSVLARLATGNISGIPGLTGSLSSSVTSLLGNSAKGLSSPLGLPLPSGLGTLLTASGVTSKIAPSNVISSYQMSGLINSLTGSSNISINDKNSASSLIGTLASTAIRSGIPNALSSLASLANGHPDILLSAGKQALSAVKSTGSLAGLSDVTTTIGSANVYNSDPNVLHLVARNYTSPTSCTAADIASEYNVATTSFAAVNPTWNAKTTQVLTVDEQGYPIYDSNGNEQYHAESKIDLTAIQSGSPDFLALMQNGSMNSTNPTEKFYGMATMFPTTTPEASLAAKYPTTVTSVATETRYGLERSAYANDHDYLAANTLISGLSRDQYLSDAQYLAANTIIR